ncbi:MAG: (Fe-S)-binding protein [Desulfovibrio sp.]|nr:(Fe-S)-binding protein [Desulfovibrio sp.]
MKAIANALSGCSQCGVCQAICPIYNLTGIESDGPRGKIAILRAVARGELTEREASASLRRCLLCGACSSACPADVPVANALERARGLIRPGKRKTRELAFDFLAGSPRLWNIVQNALFQLWRAREYCPPPLDSLGDSFPAPRERISAINTPPRDGIKRILLWPGCLAYRGLPGVLEACADVLTSTGFDLIVPDNLPCCGRPALLAGNEGKTRRLAIDALKALAAYKFDYLVAPCPRCLAAIRDVWPRLLAKDKNLKEEADAIASRAADINAFAIKYNIGIDANDLARNGTQSVPKTGAGEWIKSAQSQTLEAHCGACLPSTEKRLRRALAKDCRDRLRSTGDKRFVSSCPGKVATIRRVMRDYNDPTTIRHSIEIVAENLKQKASAKLSPAGEKKSPGAKALGDGELG